MFEASRYMIRRIAMHHVSLYIFAVVLLCRRILRAERTSQRSPHGSAAQAARPGTSRPAWRWRRNRRWHGQADSGLTENKYM